MSYTLVILPRAEKEIAHLPRQDYGRIREAIRDLTNNPRPRACRKLRDREGWRIRVGKFRIIYLIDDNQLIVRIVHVGHRRDVYR
jgi:mRNA interferase RelE/StbE